MSRKKGHVSAGNRVANEDLSAGRAKCRSGNTLPRSQKLSDETAGREGQLFHGWQLPVKKLKTANYAN